MMSNDNDAQSSELQANSAPQRELTQAEMDSIAAVERTREIEKRENSTITAKELYTAYNQNEVKADQNYKGMKVAFFGECRGLTITNVFMDDCVLVKNKEEL